MNRTCRFNKKYNKTTGLYSVSLTNLTKHQLSLFCSLFHNLGAVGPVTNYSDGVSLPCLEVRSYLPLAPGVGISYVVLSIPCLRCVPNFVILTCPLVMF